METAFTAAGHWYRGNLHMHSTKSDGKLDLEVAVGKYKELGYDFIAVTDHRITTDASHLASDDFLIIPGIELDCKDPERKVGHDVVGIGIRPFEQDPATRTGPAQTLVDTIKANGGEAILAHPYWSSQDGSDLLAVKGALGIEVFNGTCDIAGKAYGMVYWDFLLDRGVRIWGFAHDDTHRYEDDFTRGWLMVKSPKLTRDAILDALRKGHFYATQGPAILDLRLEGNTLHVHTSPVQTIHFVSNGGRGATFRGKAGESLSSAVFSKLRKGGYVRVEVVDASGLRAWSQPVFIEG